MTPTTRASLERDSEGHLVQFYDGGVEALIGSVADYIEEALRAGDAALIVATPEHIDAFLTALPRADDSEPRSRALVCLDAQSTIERYMIDERPDWRRFEQTVGAAVRAARRSVRSRGVRVYGEMVGLLWQVGQVEAAAHVESFWNRLLADDGFTLFCGYPIDVFGTHFRMREVEALLRSHNHVLPAGAAVDMGNALDRAMDDVLGSQMLLVRKRIDAEPCSSTHNTPRVEATILWLREWLPECAEAIVSRARSHYRAQSGRARHPERGASEVREDQVV